MNSYALQNETSDEKRFAKKISSNLNQVRNAAGDGLFTARVPEEQNWYIAHRLLMPCFSAANLYGMTEDMMDIISQLTLKWERCGSCVAVFVFPNGADVFPNQIRVEGCH